MFRHITADPFSGAFLHYVIFEPHDGAPTSWTDQERSSIIRRVGRIWHGEVTVVFLSGMKEKAGAVESKILSRDTDFWNLVANFG